MKPRILVVDDAPDFLRLTTEILGEAGYNVLAASTLEDARILADGANPDLILIDVRLRADNGLHLLLWERVGHPTLPVIMMSGFSDPVIEAEARSNGAEFLEKPFEPEVLIGLVERMLTRR
jgi:DNA-binding response OmpR family regulator